MPTMLAIVSKAEFEREHGQARPGDVLPFDRYESTHTTLEPLRAGGRLILVTVRPPDERLWRVAVLESPTRRLGGWTAARNATPIVDVTDHRSALRFSTGKGVSRKAGALAMSLQTPRTLTPSDEALLVPDLPPAPTTAVVEPETPEETANEPPVFDARRFPWGRVGHAYGVATDVPAMLTAISSDEGAVQRDGWRDLIAAVHQGSFYSATAPVVRHLAVMLDTVSLDDDWQLDALLTCLCAAATGCFEIEPWLGRLPAEVWMDAARDAPRDRHTRNPFTGEPMVFPAPDASEVISTRKRVHYAARHAMAGYARCLRSGSPATRSRTAYILGALVEDRDMVLPGLAAAFATERDDDVAAQLLVSAVGLDIALPRWVADALDDARQTVRRAAAYAVACKAGENLDLVARAARAVAPEQNVELRDAMLKRLSAAGAAVAQRVWAQ